MATGAGPPLASHELSEEDLAIVIEALVPVAEKLEFFGLQIGMQMNEIALIQRQFTDPCQCLLRILRTRLERNPALTWNDIDRALRSKSVGKIQLANSIKREYGHLFSHDPSFEDSLGQEESGRTAKAKGKQKEAKTGEPVKDSPQFLTQVSKLERESYKMVHQTESYKKSSQMLQMDDEHSCFVSKTADKSTEKRSTKSKKLSGPEKDYEGEIQHEINTQRKNKAVNEEESYSSEQEEDSAEEVSETERYQKPSEQPREDEYPHSHRETPVIRAKGKSGMSSTLLSKKKSKVYESGGKEKQKMKAVDQSVSDVESKNVMADDEFYQKADRKRKLPHKHQLTPKHVKLEHYSPTIGEELPSNYSGTEMNVEKSPATLVEQPNADISDVEEEQHDTVRRKRVHCGSPPASLPTSHGETQSDSISKRREAIHQKHLKRVKRRRKIKQESSSSSETDDDSSSPESDMLMNLTESENKGLIKAFKRCFGKLCLAIKDPEKAAVELQTKGLLSCSMVESLLTSPESQQEKAIALVRALKKKIKSHPVKVFTIIEVFQRNKIIKEAGRELWNETGTQTSHFPDSTEVNNFFFR